MHTGPLSGLLVSVAGVLVVIGGFASPASSALRPGVHAFEARFHDAQCRGGGFCGTGTLTGFGVVKTHIVLGRAFPGPAKGCLGVTGTRRLTPTSDAKSTLRLSVRGAVCASHTWGTFKVASGSGVFAGATGGGVIIGHLEQDPPRIPSLLGRPHAHSQMMRYYAKHRELRLGQPITITKKNVDQYANKF